MFTDVQHGLNLTVLNGAARRTAEPVTDTENYSPYLTQRARSNTARNHKTPTVTQCHHAERLRILVECLRNARRTPGDSRSAGTAPVQDAVSPYESVCTEGEVVPTQLRRQQLRRFSLEQRLADKVLEILTWSGLFHQGYSVNGGPNFYFPRVEEVINVKGSPTRLKIRMRPGQRIDDFQGRASVLEYHLNVDRVVVTPLNPRGLILMELQRERTFPLRFWEPVDLPSVEWPEGVSPSSSRRSRREVG